jgi:hypothetical protein
VWQNEGVATQTDVRPDSTTDESTGDDRPSTRPMAAVIWPPLSIGAPASDARAAAPGSRTRAEAAMDTPLVWHIPLPHFDDVD